MNEYETAMQEYNKKLSKVIEEMIEMETKRVHMLRFTSKSKMLKFEKEKIITLIKELQEDYMKKKKLETRTFELKIGSFNKRLGEIEEKLATLEAEKAVGGFRNLRLPKG
jgi:exonuclease VII large subunit